MSSPAHPLPTDETDDAGPTRERLLDAAERLFARRGFEATRVRDITLEARCNLAAVNYYFGGKENLYREVFRRRLAALREQRIAGVRSALERAGEEASLELLLGTFTSAFVEPLVEESTGRLWVQLMAWELLVPHLPREMFEAEMIAPVRRALVEALEGVCPGLGREDAELAVQSLVAQLVHIVHLRRYLRGVRPGSAAERFDLPKLVRHTVRFSAAGIRALAGRAT